MRDIGKNIRDLRAQRNLTQDALAERLFVTRQTVSNYETGKSRPDIDMLMRIAETLDTDIHTILYGPQPRDPRPLIRLAAGCSLTLALGICLLLSRDLWEAYYYNFELGPLVVVCLLAKPFLFILAGWTMIQGISILLHARQPRFRAARCCRWCILGLMAGTVLLIISHFIHLPLPKGMTALTFRLCVLAANHPYLGLFPGIGLWLCGFPNPKT